MGRACGRAVYWLAIVLGLLFAVVALTLKYAVLPNIGRYQGEIVSRVAAASGMDVSASAIRGGWDGFMPYVELENVVFMESAATASKPPSPPVVPTRSVGEAALTLPSLRASVSWWSLFVGQVRFAEFLIEGPTLSLSRRADGLLYFAGRALNAPTPTPDDGQLLAFLLDQPGVEVRNATLFWQDELRPGQDLRFTNVGGAIKKRGSAHAIGFVASPPSELAQKIEASGELKLSNETGNWTATGPVYVAASNANLRKLRQHLSVPDELQAGFGSVRAWAEIDTNSMPSPARTKDTADATPPITANPIRSITADLHVTNASAQLEPTLASLNLTKLAGRIEYKSQAGGFTISSKALELRTKDGVVLPPADFSLTLENQASESTAKGQFTGNGIDLKVMTSLVEFFPVGKDVRALFARYSPRGVVRESSFAWTGYVERLSAYKLKGNVTDFAINAFEKLPGVSGFSGAIEGDSKGGTFNIASKSLTLDAPLQFAQPLKFDEFTSGGSWNITADSVEVKLDRVSANNADLNLELQGKYSRLRSDGPRAAQEKGPGALDIKGKIMRGNALAVASYIPNGLPSTREYIKWAVQGGEITNADFLVKGDLYEFPFHQGKGGVFKVDANLKKVDFRYAEGWPIVNDIAGVLSFENTKISAKVESARIYSAQLKKTVLGIEDTKIHPSIFSLTSEVDARAEDVSRFLIESPLANSVGAFTKFAAIEGPGKLNLSLQIPIGTAEEKAASKVAPSVNGNYQLARGSAKLNFGPVVSNLSGAVAFTESSVKSSNLQGSAFGNPVVIAIASSGEQGVTTDFTARADVAQLKDVLPFNIPTQLSGTADFRGRLLPTKNGSELILDSPLVGVVSRLPYPLAKRSDESRALRVTITDVGQSAERMHVTLAANASDTAAASADAMETRIDARVQRRFDAAGAPQGIYGAVVMVGAGANTAVIPEGVWLEGALPKLDFDTWRGVVNAADAPVGTAVPATAPVSAKNTVSISGFDVKLGSVIAYGRAFKAMALKGRRAADDWRFALEGAEANGDFTWRPGAFNDRGSVRARLKNLELAEQTPSPTPIANTSNVEPVAAELPALDIVADSFKLKDRWMGKLELRATPQGENWRIDELTISNGHAKLEMDGLWQRRGLVTAAADSRTPAAALQSRTVMNLKVEASNLNALMSQFGHGDQIRGGTGKLEGKLSWPGHAFDFATVNLSGNFKFEGTNGAFTKVEAGPGKLLGLISLQSLPRRITLDFRDIFSNGFAFDRVGGDVQIDRGVMSTQNFEIVGPAAEVKMTGDITLPTERANLTFTVAPKLDETVALSAGLFTLNPLVGVVVYVGQKVIGNPFEKLFSFKYAVSGTWDNPEVERLSRGVGSPAAAPQLTQPLQPLQPLTPPLTQPATRPDGTPVANMMNMPTGEQVLRSKIEQNDVIRRPPNSRASVNVPNDVPANMPTVAEIDKNP
jgi:uncharacterized protein (TIGR02099 family)